MMTKGALRVFLYVLAGTIFIGAVGMIFIEVGEDQPTVTPGPISIPGGTPVTGGMQPTQEGE